jgi:hypothetical protein
MVYTVPRLVQNLDECYFYHSMEIPGYGAVTGEWDLRPGIGKYLGGYDFRGKRALDIGSASGFLSFHMEGAGAEIVSYDLSEDHPWDVVPHGGALAPSIDADRRNHVRRINNGYWLAHRALGSTAKVAYGTVYDMPSGIGTFDVAVYGSILLHLRDPLLALESGARRVREAIVVADIAPLGPFGCLLKRPLYIPSRRRPQDWDSWWVLPPRLVAEHLAVLGFPQATTKWHRQLFRGKHRWLYTVVARR